MRTIKLLFTLIVSMRITFCECFCKPTYLFILACIPSGDLIPFQVQADKVYEPLSYQIKNLHQGIASKHSAVANGQHCEGLHINSLL